MTGLGDQVTTDFATGCEGATRKLTPCEVLALTEFASSRGRHVSAMEAWSLDDGRHTPDLGKGIHGLRHDEKNASPDSTNRLAKELIREAIAAGGNYIFQVWLGD